MDSSSENQEMGSQTLESMLVCTRSSAIIPQQENNKKPRPADEQALKCPRCDSANTKFCYYNNYSLSQPRYFCKSCRRYWTKGGTLRNVPVGGGCRKNKRSTPSSSSSSSSSAAARIRSQQQDQQSILPPSLINPSHSLIPLSSSYDHHSSCNDLSLAIARLHRQNSLGFDHEINNDPHNNHFMWGNDPNNVISGEFLGTNGGNSSHVNTSLGLFDALGISGSDDGGAFLHSHHQQQQHAPGNSHNFYGSLIMGGMNGRSHHVVENDGGEMMGMVQDDDVYGGGGGLALKQEIRSNEQNRVLWGFPWQISNGDGGNSQPSIAWNNGIGSSNSWPQGLLNSPLM